MMFDHIRDCDTNSLKSGMRNLLLQSLCIRQHLCFLGCGARGRGGGGGAGVNCKGRAYNHPLCNRTSPKINKKKTTLFPKVTFWHFRNGAGVWTPSTPPIVAPLLYAEGQMTTDNLLLQFNVFIQLLNSAHGRTFQYEWDMLYTSALGELGGDLKKFFERDFPIL